MFGCNFFYLLYNRTFEIRTKSVFRRRLKTEPFGNRTISKSGEIRTFSFRMFTVIVIFGRVFFFQNLYFAASRSKWEFVNRFLFRQSLTVKDNNADFLVLFHWKIIEIPFLTLQFSQTTNFDCFL